MAATTSVLHGSAEEGVRNINSSAHVSLKQEEGEEKRDYNARGNSRELLTRNGETIVPFG